MSSQTPLLELRNISKNFGSIQVLDGIHFSIEPGQVVALLGDNGAGKSTLIKVIAGVHRPSSGELFWQGKAVRFSDGSGPQEARNLGIETVYQDLGLVPTMSIARNFFLGRELKRNILGISRLDLKTMAEIAKQKLAELGIRRKLNPTDAVAQLSGGERQAIAIARARHFGAKLIILDEPTSALSLRQTEEVLSFIRKASSEGMAIIFITHTLAHIEGIVDKISIIFHGKNVGDFRSDEVQRGQVASLITKGQYSTTENETITDGKKAHA